jgi:hypothetical protein
MSAATAKPVPDFQAAGEALLDKVIARFRNAGQNGLYAEKIDAAEAIDPGNQGVSYVWPASHMLRALRWGAKAAPEKYADRFHDYVFAVYRYKATVAGRAAYAVLPGSNEQFYDDNAVMLVEMALAYADLREAPVLDDAKMAYAFCHLARDTAWAIPQTPAQLGQGMFYSMAVSPVGHGAAILARVGGGTGYRDDAAQYYARMMDRNRRLLDTSGLFIQYSFHTGGVWTTAKTVNGTVLEGRGFRAYQTTYVIRLALELYQATGDAKYLMDAKAMMQACLARFYTEGKGLRENGFWGGNDMVDALEDLYEASGESSWHGYARDIVAYLIEHGRDAQGWYPSDEDDAKGDWNLDRKTIGPGTVSMMGQAAAASAMLRVAYASAHPAGVRVPAFRKSQGSSRVAAFAGRGEGFARIPMLVFSSANGKWESWFDVSGKLQGYLP